VGDADAVRVGVKGRLAVALVVGGASTLAGPVAMADAVTMSALLTVTEVDDTSVARRKYGLPEKFAGCHTAVVGGYVVEGHVPASDVKKLLVMKPVAIGLTVLGMPVGSPGMEMGSRKDHYQVLLVAKDGRERVFATYN
jgi:hypothetical protein